MKIQQIINQSRRLTDKEKAIISIATWVLYISFVYLFPNNLGFVIFVLSSLPVVITAWLFGNLWSTIACVLVYFVWMIEQILLYKNNFPTPQISEIFAGLLLLFFELLAGFIGFILYERKYVNDSKSHIDYILNHTGIGVCITSLNGKIIDISQHLCEMIGCIREKMIDQDLSDIIYLDDRSILKDLLNKITNHSIDSFHIEIRLVRCDGAIIWTDMNCSLPPNRQRNKDSLMIVIEDISERKSYERTLRRREAILDAVSYAANSFTRSNSWRDNLFTVLGHLGTASEVSHVLFFEQSASNEGKEHSCCSASWAADGNDDHKDKLTLQDLDLSNKPIYKHWERVLKTNKVIQGIASTFSEDEQALLRSLNAHSILIIPIFSGLAFAGSMWLIDCEREYNWQTSEVEALKVAADTMGVAIQRQQSQEALLHSETSYQSLFNTVPVGLFRTKPDGTIIDINPATVQLFGFPSRDNLLNSNAKSLYINPEDRMHILNLLEKEGEIHNFEWQMRRFDGSLIWIRENCRSIRDDSGEIIQIEGSLEDITENKNAEEILKKSNNKLISLLNDLETHHQEIQYLNEMNQALQTCQFVEETYAIITEFGERLFPDMSGTLNLLLPDQEDMFPVTTWGQPMLNDPVDPQGCRVFQHGEVYVQLTGDILGTCPCIKTRAKELNNLQAICTPMLAHETRIGTISLEIPDQRSNEHWQSLLLSFSDQLALSIANLQLREKLHTLSISDPLTGLYNRRYMEEILESELQRADRYQRPLAVLMMDIDHFKNCNDQYGHEIGDIILKKISNFILSRLRRGDITCRFGGEEFVVVMPETSMNGALVKAEQICSEISRFTIPYEGKKLGPITLSIGVAFASPGITAREILRMADLSLYRAKAGGRNRVELQAEV